MAINNNTNNKLFAANDTGVKFYSSLTRDLALGKVSLGKDKDDKDIFVEPGAVCFVSDSKGNSIFLNKLLFGDGAKSSGEGGGITEIALSDIVITEKDGNIIKSLADYFNLDGDLISDTFKVVTTNALNELVDSVVINKDGILIGGSPVVTEYTITSNNDTVLETAKGYADTALTDAKSYTDSLLTTVYKVKGSKDTYKELEDIVSPLNGDVWNVKGPHGTTPAGTNWVYIKVDDEESTDYPGYWDALGGSMKVELEDYPNRQDLSTALDTLKTLLEGSISGAKEDIINNNITPISNTLTNISGDISTLKTNVTSLTMLTTQNTTNITNIATQLTWQ